MSAPARARRWTTACGAVAAIALAAPGGASGATPHCQATSGTLSPPGSGFERFTMLLRVNQAANARIYANSDAASGGLAGRISPQDVFVVNTRFSKSAPREWERIVSILGTAFPCNRIVTLNGLGANPAAPGYAYALADSPRLWAVLTDWERDDWNAGRATNPAMGGWTGRFDRTRKRVRRWVAGLTMLSSSAGTGRTGIAPQYRAKWDYGRLGRTVSGQNRLLGQNRRGIQSVQTQDFCADSAGDMRSITGELLRDYKRANLKKVRSKRRGGKRWRYRSRGWRTKQRNLGLQVSFSNTPNPAAGMAILRTSPQRAAKCTRTALKRGGGAIFYWASPDSIRALFAVPRFCMLRPPPPGMPC